MTMGERPGMPMYPAAMTALRPTMVPTRWQPVRIAAAVLCFVALVLAVASVFLPLYSGEVSLGGLGGTTTSIEMTFTPWSVDISPAESGAGSADVPHVGYPLVFAAVFLAGAVCACWYAATPSAGHTASRAAGVTTVAGGAFLIGTAWTTATLVASGVDYFITLGTLGQGLESNGHYLAGYWLLLASALVGFAAAVLSLLPTRRPAFWQSPRPVNPYLATPPYGMARPPQGQAVVYALPMEPAPGRQAPVRGLTVDPLTGQPLVQGPPNAPGGPAAAVGPPIGQSFAHSPVSPPGGLPAAPTAPVTPTGQPVPGPFAGQSSPQATQHLGPVDPLTGQPLAPGLLTPAAPTAAPEPGTPEPVGQVNGAHLAPPTGSTATEPPVALPDAPPPPAPPRGPAVPSTEDPLAEPPRPS